MGAQLKRGKRREVGTGEGKGERWEKGREKERGGKRGGKRREVEKGGRREERGRG